MLETLTLTLREAMAFNRQDALAMAGSDYREECITLVKRSDLVRHLRAQGCELLREGSRHSWWWNPLENRR